MIVQKFGGTSVQDHEAIARLIDITRGERFRLPVVVVSAMGRTTNQLFHCAEVAAQGRLAEARVELDRIVAAHLETVRKTSRGAGRALTSTSVERHFGEAAQALVFMAEGRSAEARLVDALTACGELASSAVVAGAMKDAGLPAEWVDIRPMMVTEADFGRAPVVMEAAHGGLQAGFEPLLSRELIPVTQGFIGSTRTGLTTTIGRGGSDYSAAIIGAALSADEIQIWTDVDGVMTTDPRIVPEAAPIDSISFAEAAELAYFGASVLHPLTLRPAMEKDIPVRVLNSRNPDARGTTIMQEAADSPFAVRAIAVKKEITVLKVASDRMLLAYGFLARLFEIFSRHRTAIDMVTTSEVTVSMTLDDTRHLDAILKELETCGDVSIDRDQAIICLVGDGLKAEPELVARVFSAVRKFPVSMISHGASAINISFVVPAEVADQAVAALHGEFFSGERMGMEIGRIPFLDR